jgi:hypothetical protein
MSRRIIRNGLLVMGLCAVATLMPAQQSVAQTQGCTTQACENCVTYWGHEYNNCVWGCAVIGAPGCPEICDTVYNANVVNCYNL